MDITIVRNAVSEKRSFNIDSLIIAGWTGRDPVALEKHIKELEELGVPRPNSTPVFYRISASRLTTANKIQVSGEASSGEVEYVLLNINGELLVGLGSDHTDREVESYGITVSKQICEKPIGSVFWPLKELEDHWDSLQVRSYAVDIKGKTELYQEGTLQGLLAPKELIQKLRMSTNDTLQSGWAMFGGTVAAIGGVRSAQRFEFELEDPVLKRNIQHYYEVEELDIVA